LHLQKKYHGGMKPSNILINNEGVVKLSDYNISSQLLNINNQNNKLSHSLYKMPPELTNKNNSNKNSYSI
jgi:serine/threonine protein kinase